MADIIHRKCVVIGDTGVGKSSLINTFRTGAFPTEYIPTIFDGNMSSHIIVDKCKVSLGIWDTHGNDEYDRLRPLSYPESNIFLICYCITSIESFNRITSKWIPEMNNYLEKFTNCPFIIVGNKMDLRTDEFPILYCNDIKKKYIVEGYVHKHNKSSIYVPDDIMKLLALYIPESTTVNFENVKKVGKAYGAKECIECSALKQQNIQYVFEQAARIALQSGSRQKKKNCAIM